MIRKEIEKEFRSVIASRFEHHVSLTYVFQDLSDVPSGFSVPPGRVKPWGTGHAVWAARDVVSEPFAVVNADDFYGRESYVVLADYLKNMSSCDSYYCMVGFVLDKTLSEMLHHSWPGNVRELKNAVERMTIASHAGEAAPFTQDESFGAGRHLSLPATPGRLRDEMERTERTSIEAALRENRGEINATCHALGISRRALNERMKRYALNKQNYRDPS